MKRVVKYNDKLFYDYELVEYLEELKKYRNTSLRRMTVIKNIVNKSLVWYVTFTLNKELKDGYSKDDLKKLQTSMKKIFSRYNVNYYLVPEIQPKSKLLHFHGLISDNDFMVFSGHQDKYKNDVYHFAPMQKNYGFTNCIFLFDKPYYVRKKIINYVIKYIDNEDNFKSMSNRKICDTKYQDVFQFFGIYLVKIEK